jgi:hypothetical protein
MKAAFAQSVLDSANGLFDEIIDIEAAGRRRLTGAGVDVSYVGVARKDGTDNGEQVSAELLEQSMDALTLAINDGSFLTTLQAADSAFAAVTVDVAATQAALLAATVVFVVTTCVEIKILRRVRAESSRRPPRYRRDACSMAWRCRFLAARRSQHGRVITEK